VSFRDELISGSSTLHRALRATELDIGKDGTREEDDAAQR
jgi:hypothetical protein